MADGYMFVCVVCEQSEACFSVQKQFGLSCCFLCLGVLHAGLQAGTSLDDQLLERFESALNKFSEYLALMKRRTKV